VTCQAVAVLHTYMVCIESGKDWKMMEFKLTFLDLKS